MSKSARCPGCRPAGWPYRCTHYWRHPGGEPEVDSDAGDRDIAEGDEGGFHAQEETPEQARVPEPAGPRDFRITDHNDEVWEFRGEVIEHFSDDSRARATDVEFEAEPDDQEHPGDGEDYVGAIYQTVEGDLILHKASLPVAWSKMLHALGRIERSAVEGAWNTRVTEFFEDTESGRKFLGELGLLENDDQ